VLLSVVSRQSRAAGDSKLALRTEPVLMDGVYTYCGHGAVNLYADERVGEVVRMPEVPLACAYITSAELGRGTCSDDLGDKTYRTMWHEEPEGLKLLLLDCMKEGEEGDEARRDIETWFANPEETRSTAKIYTKGQRYTDSYVLPCFMSHDAGEDVNEGELVRAYPSGIQTCDAGVNLNDSVVVPDDVITEDIIQFIYGGSIFPTVDQILNTEGMAEILLQNPGGPPKPNRNEFILCVYKEWLCTSTALLLSFPGVHVNTLCAYSGPDAVRNLLAPPSRRRAYNAGSVRRLALLPEKNLDAHELPVLLRSGDIGSLPWGKFGSDGKKYPNEPPNKLDPHMWSPSERSWAVGQLLIQDAYRLGLTGAVLCKPVSKASASQACLLARRNTRKTTQRRRRSKSKTRRNR